MVSATTDAGGVRLERRGDGRVQAGPGLVGQSGADLVDPLAVVIDADLVPGTEPALRHWAC